MTAPMSGHIVATALHHYAGLNCLAPVSNPPSRRAVYTSVEFEMICVAAAMVWWMQNHECQPGRSDLVTLPKGREGAHDLPRRCST